MENVKKNNRTSFRVLGWLKRSLISFWVVLIALIFTIPFIIVNNNKKESAPAQIEQSDIKDKSILGVYYAKLGEIAVANVAGEFTKSNGGLLYIGKGSVHTMNGGKLSGQSAINGGAVYVADGGTFILNDGEISNNQAIYGGAIYVAKGGECYLNGGKIINNAATGAAAIYVEDGGTLVVRDCIIENNTILNITVINYYVDGVIAKREYTMNQDNIVFDASKSPLDYQNCCGYFKDAEMTQGIENGENIGTVVQSIAAAESEIVMQEYNLYTKTATPDKLMFVLNGDNNSYNVRQIDPSTTNGVVVIPREYAGKNVTKIHEANSSSDGAFYNNNSITEVYLPNTITSIANYSFVKDSANSTLQKVTLPSAITSIGASAFRYCTGLIDLTLPYGVTDIGREAFQYCMALTSITIPAYVTGIGYNSFRGCSGLTSVIFAENAQVTTISDYAFSDCTSLTGIIIPDSVSTIGEYTFNNCPAITNAIIGSGVTKIGTKAFRWCTGLTSIYYNGEMGDWFNISFGSSWKDGAWSLYINNTVVTDVTVPSNITRIGQYRLYNCSSLTSVTIPSSVTNIGESAFASCTNLATINFEGQLIDWCNIGFGTNWITKYWSLYIGEEKVTNLVIPSSMTSVKFASFMYCSGLESVTIPDSVTTIANFAFYYCNNITSVNIGNNVTSLGSYSFSRCGKLSGSVVLPSGLTDIGSVAFQQCGSITDITIPQSVKNIGYAALESCENLEKIYYGGQLANWCNINVGNDWINSSWSLYIGGNKVTDLIIPTGVTSIKARIFMYCVGITSLSISDSVTSIGASTFNYCTGLTNISIGNGVTSIDQYAFSGCNNLTSIIIPDNVLDIGNGIFRICRGLISAIVGNNVVEIKRDTFYRCEELTSVTIGSGVTNIGFEAFFGCFKLDTVIIDSETIAGLTSADSSYLIFYATTIYVKDTITSIGSYVTNRCPYEVESDKTGYRKYIKNQ